MEGRGIGDYGSEGDDGWKTMDGRLWMGDRVWESMVELKSIGVGAKLALARPGMSGRSMACRSTLQPLTNGASRDSRFLGAGLLQKEAFQMDAQSGGGLPIFNFGNILSLKLFLRIPVKFYVFKDVRDFLWKYV